MDPFINNFRKNIDKRKNSVMLQTSSICHKDFKQIAEMFYDKDRKKHIPKNLDIYFTPLTLAVWIMDDGNLKSKCNYRIASMGFTKEDNELLQSYLLRCFDVRSKVVEYTNNKNNKKYYSISINKENSQKVSNIIEPYVVDCMKYKLMPKPSTTNMPNSNDKLDDDRV